MGLVSNLGSNTRTILSTKNSAKFLSGARCTIKINKRLVGFAFGITWNIQTIADELFTIDNWLPTEIVPKYVKVDGTLSMFHVPGKGPSLEFIQCNTLSFVFQQYIEIEVRDSSTDWLLFYAPQAMVTTRAEDVRAENLATAQLSWKAIGWSDEIGTPKMPENYDKSAKDANKKSSVLNPNKLVDSIKSKIPSPTGLA